MIRKEFRSVGWQRLFRPAKKPAPPEGLSVMRPKAVPAATMSYTDGKPQTPEKIAAMAAARSRGGKRGGQSRRRRPPPSRVGL